jgi:putative nucleotidyltransferase with HDIG domain
MFGSAKKSARLIQWNGRTRSSRHEEPVLKRLCRTRVLMRLAVVLATTLVVTLLAIWWGPPMPYRVGEIHPHELRARVDFEVINHIELANLEKSLGITKKPVAADASGAPPAPDRPVIEKYPKGMLLVPRGHPIQDRQLDLLIEEHHAFVFSLETDELVKRGLSLFLIFSLLSSLVVMYVARFQTGLAHNLPMIAGVCVLVLGTVVLGTLLSQSPWNAGLLPLTFTAMVLTMAYNPQFALMMSFGLLLGLSLVLGTSVEYLLVQMGGLATAILMLRHVRTRTQLVQVATSAGVAYFVTTLAIGLLTGQTVSLILIDAFRNFLWGSLSGFVLTGVLPLVERAFGIVTDISLLELADGSHPLLQELVRRAPGTYTHSMTVATIAEAAAESIGANPLLIRVGSYFHDIGKMLKPQYFIENQNGENRHNQLEPALSTLVIIGHVKDGLALAEQYQLPRPIVEFIAQHHGTTLVEYFYREAMRIQETTGTGNADLEACFRYPGPKPQNRENGILMLVDAVESTSRSLAFPTPGSLTKLVHDLLMKRLLDGQFEESGLTLTELHTIEESLCKSLIALFHARIKYPEMEPLKLKAA